VSVQYLDLTDNLAIACEVTGLEFATIVKIVDIGLADSALHAPMAGFSGQELYPDFVEKAAGTQSRINEIH
jgi:death on curing protein